MAVAARAQVRIQGTLPGGESWSINPQFIGNFSTQLPSQAETQQWADAAATAIQNASASIALQALSSAAAITETRVDVYGTAGTLIRTAEHVLSTPIPGTGGASKPLDAAIVLSLRTGIPGRSYRGRLYWPALGVAIDSSTCYVNPGVLGGILSGLKAILAGVEAACPGAYDPVLAVYSQKLGQGVAVNQLLMGNVLDSQSRRRKSQAETYSPVAFP